MPATDASRPARRWPPDRLHPGRYQIGTRVYTVRASGHIIRDGAVKVAARYWDGHWHAPDRAPLETIIADPLEHIIEAGGV